MLNSTATPKVFVSYSRADTKEVLPLVDRLEKESSVHFWIDREGIESAAQFEDVIIRAIERAEIVLFMLSNNSQNSQWTKDEISYARNISKRVVPIVLNDSDLQGWFLFKFGRVNYIDASREDQLQRLVKDLRQWLHVENDQNIDGKQSHEGLHINDVQTEKSKKTSQKRNKIENQRKTSPNPPPKIDSENYSSTTLRIKAVAIGVFLLLVGAVLIAVSIFHFGDGNYGRGILGVVFGSICLFSSLGWLLK